MKEELKNQIDLKQGNYGFIKVTDQPVDGISDSQKVQLIRKANALFNEGKFDLAKRIYMTAGYSDGLTRLGDKYAEKNEVLEALKMYVLAHNKRKIEPLVEKMSKVVSVLIKEDS